MEIPIKLDETILKYLKEQGNVCNIPKYPKYQHINNETTNYMWFPDVCYKEDNGNIYYLTNPDIPKCIYDYKKEYTKEYYDRYTKYIELHKKYNKIPNWIKKIFKAI